MKNYVPPPPKSEEKSDDKINETNFKEPKVSIISNVTANPTNSTNEIKTPSVPTASEI